MQARAGNRQPSRNSFPNIFTEYLMIICQCSISRTIYAHLISVRMTAEMLGDSREKTNKPLGWLCRVLVAALDA